jgi:hypothetical protein
MSKSTLFGNNGSSPYIKHVPLPVGKFKSTSYKYQRIKERRDKLGYTLDPLGKPGISPGESFVSALPKLK